MACGEGGSTGVVVLAVLTGREGVGMETGTDGGAGSKASRDVVLAGPLASRARLEIGLSACGDTLGTSRS